MDKIVKEKLEKEKEFITIIKVPYYEYFKINDKAKTVYRIDKNEYEYHKLDNIKSEELTKKELLDRYNFKYDFNLYLPKEY